MSGLGCLIMTAVIDQSFRDRLLAAPGEAARDFELTEYERRAVTSIRAGSFTEFADQLQGWLDESDPVEVARRPDGAALWFEADRAESAQRRTGPASDGRGCARRLTALQAS